MAAEITNVRRFSPAHRAGIRVGERLAAIDGHIIHDVLDYRFYSYDAETVFTLENSSGVRRDVHVRKADGQDAGLTFSTYLMDRARRCSNKCVFCFIDQLPKGLRETLYFKDDDARMSFLMGNYISLTNLSEDDVSRMVRMRVSPINISVQTTDPKLRDLMLGNPSAGESLKIMERFRDAGITMNCQVVVCPGLNDGVQLEKTLSDLVSMAPEVSSISVVPVGLTKHRSGLYPLEPVDAACAGRIIDTAERIGDKCLKEIGRRLIYPSDELYLRAERELPAYEFYDEFPQLENGVGMMRLFEAEFRDALDECEISKTPEPFTVVTGCASASFIASLLDEVKIKCDNIKNNICVVKNEFLGESVDVAGLLSGHDIAAALKRGSYGRVLIPATVLRHGEDVFLDDMHVSELAAITGAQIIPVETNGSAFLSAILED